MNQLENMATRSRTTRLWLDSLIKPVLNMMMFVRAEREGDWPLHLLSVKAMLPYFFGAGHWNYARYGLYYLRSMEKLLPEVVARFLKGEHVMRHRPGLWNAIWSDMFIETNESTFMRYGHGPGGLIGITLNPGAQKRWALSLHICSRLMKDIAELREVDTQSQQATIHKEEMPARIDSDKKDREQIRKKLQVCIDPFNPEEHPADKIVNIVSGVISSPAETVDNAIAIAQQQMRDYESSWPEGFHTTLSKKVVTMAATKQKISLGSDAVFDTNLIYGRVMGLMNTRVMNLEDIFHHELAPVPTSMFDDNGDMRVVTTKAVLKNKLQCVQTARAHHPSIIILDGCAVLWTIHWPTQGTVQDYVVSFSSVIIRKLRECSVHLIFDRYYPYSIKSCTRTSRAGKASRHHQLSLDTPLPPQHVVLTVAYNKKQLIDILCQHILQRIAFVQASDAAAHKLVLTGFDPVPTQVSEGVQTVREDLRTTHEEADVIIARQMVSAAREGHLSIKVVSDDTDVFLLLMHFYHQCELLCPVVMESTSKERTVIDIGQSARNHQDILPQLLAAHALSGCDTAAYMWGVGKATVLKTLQKGFHLDKVGDVDATLEDVIRDSTAFVSGCYKCSTRYEAWLLKTCKRQAASAPKLKSLPPTTTAFIENVKRAHLQTAIWKSTLDKHPPDLQATDFGWIKNELSYSLQPITLPPTVQPAPAEVLSMLKCGCGSDQPCGTARCGCSTAQMTCTVFCKCFLSGGCQNLWTKRADSLPEEQDASSDDDSEADDLVERV